MILYYLRHPNKHNEHSKEGVKIIEEKFFRWVVFLMVGCGGRLVYEGKMF